MSAVETIYNSVNVKGIFPGKCKPTDLVYINRDEISDEMDLILCRAG